MTPSAIILKAKQQGVHLYLKDNRLAFKANKDAFTTELRTLVSENKTQITELLQTLSAQNEMIPKRANNSTVPLTQAQQRMFFLYKLDNTSSAYNMTFGLEISGELDQSKLINAIKESVAAHSILNSVVADEDGENYLQFSPNMVPAIEMSEVYDDDISLQTLKKNLFEKNYRRNINLENGPTVFIELVKYQKTTSLLYFTAHHIFFDGLSFDLLSKEILSRYFDSPQQTSHGINFEDYAVWQKNTEKNTTSLAFWEDRLLGIPQCHSLPLDRERKPEISPKGCFYKPAFEHELYVSLKMTAAELGVSLFSLLHSAYSLTVALWSRQDDIVTGVPVSGRQNKQLQNVVGMFANTLVYRAQFDFSKSFSETVKQQHQLHLDGLSHQSTVLEDIVAKVQPNRSMDHTPLFQLFFNLLTVEEYNQNDDLLKFKPIAVDGFNMDSKFDLSINFIEQTTLEICWDFDQNLFDESSIRQLHAGLIAILRTVVADPDISLKKINISNNDIPIEIAQSDCQSTFSKFLQNVAQKPNTTAIKYEEESISYQQLALRVNALAKQIAQHTHQFDCIAIIGERNIEFLTAMLACLGTGRAYIPIDDLMPSARKQLILETAQAGAVINCGAKTFEFGSLKQIEAYQGESTDSFLFHENACDTAYIIYTSGSTGIPKGVAISQQNLAAFIDAMGTRVAFDESDSILALTTPSFDISLVEMMMPLTKGGTVLMSTAQQSKDSAALANLITQNKPDYIQATPATWQMLLAESDLNLKSITALVGGEALSYHLADQLTSRCGKVWNCYGPTEATVWSLVGEVTKQSLNEKGVTIANELKGYHHFVVDKYMNVLPKGAIGELVISGDGVGLGYWHDPSQTTKVFRTDILKGYVCYLTGDLVKQNADDSYSFLGRVDHQVKVRGYRIELTEIERQLQTVIGADIPCAVTTKPDQQGFMNLVGYCCTETLSWSEVEAELALHLPDYMIPRQWVSIQNLPVNANGKVNRAQLPDIEISTNDYVAPSNEIESELQSIWQRLLNIDEVSVKDNFFSLGGNSLQINKMLYMIKDEMGQQLALSLVFKSPTITQLAQLIKESGKGEEILPVIDGQMANLSSAQLRIWITEKLGVGASNNIPMALLLEGELDVPRLNLALKQVMNKHAALRTSISEHEEIAHQVVRPLSELQVPWSFNQNQEALNNSQLQVKYAQFMSKAFDLSNGPLFKIHLEQLSSQQFALFSVFHHIVFDGWSFGVFLNDMINTYVSLGADPDFRLAVNTVGYPDYANWQQTWLIDSTTDNLREFWRKNLSHAPQETRLTADQTVATEVDAAREVIELDSELINKLKLTARKLDTNLFNLLFGTFNLLVSKLTGQADIVTGIPVAGRELSQTQDMIGMFVNNLPIRVQVDENDSVAEYLTSHMHVLTEVFEHQALPFESIIELAAQQRTENATPLFQTFFNMLNLPEPKGELEGIDIKPLFSEDVAAKFDLTLYVSELETRTQLLLVYQPGRFTQKRMVEFLKQYLSLLEQIVSNQSLKLHDIEITSSSKIHSLEKNWFGSVASKFAEHTQLNPQKPAIDSTSGSLTYRELAKKRAQLAHYLRSFDLQKGEVIAVAAKRNTETVAAILAISHFGCAFTLVDLSHGEEKVTSQLEASTAKIFLYPEDEEVSEYIKASIHSVRLPEMATWHWPELDAPCTVQANDLACVSFTSGSTGQVKAVRGSHAGLANYLNWFTEKYQINQQDRVSMLSGLTHDPLQRDIFEALCTGATLVIPDEQDMQPGTLSQWIETADISIMHMTPSQTLLIGPSEKLLESVRHIFLVGELLTENVISRLRNQFPLAKVHNVYGATETQRCLSFNECGPDYDPTCISSDFPDSQFRVHQKNGALSVLGQIGEIVVWSHNLSLGYMNDPQLTEEKFIYDEFGNRGYKTGDLGYELANGTIRLLGRDDRQIKLRGYRIELGEVESHLEKCLGVKQAAVSFVQDTEHEHLAAYIAVDEQFEMTAAKKQLRSNMPIYMIPTYWSVKDSLPLNSSGKVDYRQLNGASLLGSESLIQAKTSSEHALMKIWLKILPVSQIGIENNFFESGGHSIDAANMLASIKQEFGLDLSLRQVFENPTIKEMAYLLDSLEAKALLNSTENDNNNNNIEVIEL